MTLTSSDTFIIRQEENEEITIRPRYLDIEYGGQFYKSYRIFLYVFTIGYFRQVLKDFYFEFDNFILDAVDWICSDGLAILFATTVFPRCYQWLEETNYIDAADILFIIMLLLFVVLDAISPASWIWQSNW